MPTVLLKGPYRFYFYSHEPNEPMHVHVDEGKKTAKFWLEPLSLARNYGYKAQELNNLVKIIRENRDDFVRKWNEYFRE